MAQQPSSPSDPYDTLHAHYATFENLCRETTEQGDHTDHFLQVQASRKLVETYALVLIADSLRELARCVSTVGRLDIHAS